MTRPAVIPCDPGTPLEAWPDFPESEVCSGTRASIGHRWIEDAAQNLVIGMWEAEPNLGRWMNWPVHEFMVILEGEVVMVEEGCETVIGPGECFVIPKGRRCIWNQAVYAKKVMVLFDPPSPPDPMHPILKIVPAALPDPPPDGAVPLFRDPSGRLAVSWVDIAGQGVQLPAHPCHEVLHIVAGRLAVTDDTGGRWTFGPNDTFIITKGMRLSFAPHGPVRAVSCRVG